MRRRKGNPYLGITVDSCIAEDFFIVKESTPLVEQGYIYQAYRKNGKEVWGFWGMTVEELISKLKKSWSVKSISIEDV